MKSYEKAGYLKSDFRIFHLVEKTEGPFEYHYHDFAKILFFVRGDVTYHIEGRMYKLCPYDLVLIRPGEVHRPVVEKKTVYERVILYISPEILSSGGEEEDLFSCFRKAEEEDSHVLRFPRFIRNELFESVTELEKECEKNEFAGKLCRKVLFLKFMVELNRAVKRQGVHYMGEKEDTGKIAEIIEYLNKNLQEDLTIDRLSEHFYLSRYYMMHRFKEETGYTIGQYVSTKRLLRARNLIQEGVPVTEACYECGFRNYSTFSRAYKKQFGMSAKEYKI